MLFRLTTAIFSACEMAVFITKSCITSVGVFDESHTLTVASQSTRYRARAGRQQLQDPKDAQI